MQTRRSSIPKNADAEKANSNDSSPIVEGSVTGASAHSIATSWGYTYTLVWSS